MPIAGAPYVSAQMRKGGLKADSQFSSRMGTTFKDKRDLKLRINPFHFDNDDDELDEVALPFDDDEYFDINAENELFEPDNDFYNAYIKRRSGYEPKTDYQAKVSNQSAHSGGRMSARQRSSANTQNPYPGGPKKMSFRDLRSLIKNEVVSYITEKHDSTEMSNKKRNFHKMYHDDEDEVGEMNSIAAGGISGYIGPLGASRAQISDPENPKYRHKKKKK